MTRQETGIIMDILSAAYPRFYSGPDAPDMRSVINLWAEMFAREDVALVAAAVKSIIEGDEGGFPPNIGQVKAKMRLLTGTEDMTEAEAWNQIARAVRNGIYGANEEFQRLTPLLQRIVGSPAQLREWAMMDSRTLHSVVASNFQRSYRTAALREREMEKLPPEVRTMVQRMEAKGARLPGSGGAEKPSRRTDGTEDRKGGGEDPKRPLPPGKKGEGLPPETKEKGSRNRRLPHTE